MKSGESVRPATVGDAFDVARIHVETWRQAYKGIVPDAYLEGLSVERRADFWVKTLSESTAGTLVAVDAGGRVVGWASFGASRDEDGRGLGEVYAVYLQSADWGKGIGRALMAAAERRLTEQGFSIFTLWVLELNSRTRRFYDKAGYKPDGAKKAVGLGGKELIEVRYRKSAPRINVIGASGAGVML